VAAHAVGDDAQAEIFVDAEAVLVDRADVTFVGSP